MVSHSGHFSTLSDRSRAIPGGVWTSSRDAYDYCSDPPVGADSHVRLGRRRIGFGPGRVGLRGFFRLCCRADSAMNRTSLRPPLRVLVVDDCPDTTFTLATLLRLWGHDGRVAHDGPAALAAARAY